MEGSIQFVANYDDWRVIKKISITDKTMPLTIVEFIASLTYSTDEKIEQNLRKTIELSKVDTAIKELELGKKDVGKAIEEVSSRKINSVINEICKLDKFDGPTQKELIQLCKIYAVKKVLKECEVLSNYHEADISTLKRAKKASAKK